MGARGYSNERRWSALLRAETIRRGTVFFREPFVAAPAPERDVSTAEAIQAYMRELARAGKESAGAFDFST
jgi:hypothetical protein